jgi:hypothetical protein
MSEHHKEGVYSAIHFDEDLLELPVPMMLERMIEVTGEFQHLVELIDIHIGINSDNSGISGFHEIVQPVLTGLDHEIRNRFRPGMEFTVMRLIVQDWIDAEIRRLCRQNS